MSKKQEKGQTTRELALQLLKQGVCKTEVAARVKRSGDMINLWISKERKAAVARAFKEKMQSYTPLERSWFLLRNVEE